MCYSRACVWIFRLWLETRSHSSESYKSVFRVERIANANGELDDVPANSSSLDIDYCYVLSMSWY
jgi:hypothetical protein